MSLIVKYLEGKRFEVTCRGHTIIADQPSSEDGTDQGMDPVEIFNAGLASCAAFYAMTFLSRRIKNLKGLEIQSSWFYSEDPHRIGEISLTVMLPFRLSESEKKGLVRTLEHCTIKNTLKHPPNIVIKLG
jgi:putative redox protein